MNEDNLAPAEGTDRKYRVTDGGKLEENDEADGQEFEELTFDD